MSNYKKFLEFEEKFQCYNINNWQSIRSYIYECFCGISRVYSPPSKLHIVIQIINSLISFKITFQSETPVYFGLPRRINSVYSDEGKTSMEHLDKFIYFNQSKTNTKIKREYCSPTTLIILVSKIASYFYNTLSRETFEIFSEINISKRKVNEIIIYNNLFYLYFKFLFFRLKPKYIFYTRSDNFYALLKACNRFKIKSIEFQHGDIVKEEVSINHQKKNEAVIYAPDILLAYSKIWTHGLNIGRNTKTIVIGKKIKPLEDGTDQILILIDTYHNLDQIHFIQRLRRITEIPIILKVHPNQNYRPVAKYLRKKFNDNLIKVIHYERSYEQLLNLNTILIGGYSTSIYFALNHGIKVYYIKSDYREVNQSEFFENFSDYKSYNHLLKHLSSTEHDRRKIKTIVQTKYYEDYKPEILKSINEYL